MSLTTEEAYALIAKKLEQVEVLIREAEAIADEYDCEFSFDGPSYGMGGWYNSGEWNASSMSC